MAAGKITLQANDGKTLSLVAPEGMVANTSGVVATADNIAEVNAVASSHIGLSGITAYHLLQGNLAVDNTVTTQGFNTTLYDGNSSTQSIDTGIDMATQWGNDVSEQFGGLVWLKSRGVANWHHLHDTIRGATKSIQSSTTNAEGTYDTLTSFLPNGFSIGADAGVNMNNDNMASWNFQTTHRVSGTTNHGKAYTCHFNPFTGFTIVKYEGSGIAGHEIPHHLGRKLGFVTVKNLSATASWISLKDDNNYMLLDLTNAQTSTGTTSTVLSDVSFIPYNNSALFNSTGNNFIMYGWANSYIDESNKLIGNYEVGVYQGTGASGNKVLTRGKPAWVMIKRIDSTGNWHICDALRSNFDARLVANQSIVESTSYEGFSVGSNYFESIYNGAEDNASGGQYLYMVAYDTNSDGGGSYYPRATDTSSLQVQNAIIPFANGVDSNGTKITTLSKNETFSDVTFTEGKNYPYYDNTGARGVSKYAPCYGLVPTRTKAGETPDFFDIVKNKWFTTIGGSELVTNGNFDSDTSGWTAGTSGTVAVVNGAMRITVNGTSYPSMWYNLTGLEIGKEYLVSVDLNSSSAIETVPILNIYYSNKTTSLAGSGVIGFGIRTFTFIAPATEMTIRTMCQSTTNGVWASFDNISVFEVEPTIGTEITESRNYLNHIVYADNDGSPLYVEELPKVEYKDVIKANEYRGKNACTAWVNFDGTTTPPTIRDSYNISSVVRTSTGAYDVYFAIPMDNVNYSVIPSTSVLSNWSSKASTSTMSINKVGINISSTNYNSYVPFNEAQVCIEIKGGKN